MAKALGTHGNSKVQPEQRTTVPGTDTHPGDTGGPRLGVKEFLGQRENDWHHTLV